MTDILFCLTSNFSPIDGDFLVNIFSPEQRRNYNLEILWKKGEVLDVSDCLVGAPEEPEPVSKDSSLDDWLTE